MGARLEAIVRPPGTMATSSPRDDWTTLERVRVDDDFAGGLLALEDPPLSTYVATLS